MTCRFLIHEAAGQLPSAPPILREPKLLFMKTQEITSHCGITLKQYGALVREGIFPRHKLRRDLMKHLKAIAIEASDGRESVYFMEMNKFIKIGRSRDPFTRREKLQESNPFDIILLATFPGTEEQEMKLHNLFRKTRVRGEWFERTPGLLAYITWMMMHFDGDSRVLRATPITYSTTGAVR